MTKWATYSLYLCFVFHVRHSLSYYVALLSLELAYADHAGLAANLQRSTCQHFCLPSLSIKRVQLCMEASPVLFAAP